jgi:YidC/Oxa1 family membrane protein insertase
MFHNDGYTVDLSIETQNTPAFKLPIGTDFGIFDPEAGMRSHSGPVILDAANKKTDFGHDDDNEFINTGIKWIAQEDQYFTAALVPLGAVDGTEFWKEGASPEIAVKLQPGKHDFILYAGPKEYDRLKALDKGLEHMIDFGWFAFIAMPLFWVLKYFYSYMGNYGWAIMVLTILVRIPFIPILNKSQQSMKKMQKVQPLMAELKEKYKNDAAKMQKETMALYKKHKVNPIGGCLPMFLQIPVFIALYNVLLKAIELRGAPFGLWITDLAVKDPYYVMPIVMGATMVLQQKMTPTAMDPKQAKMMMLMPIVFTFMFLSFPAGLVLYWLVNNVLGIGQQYFVNKKAD